MGTMSVQQPARPRIPTEGRAEITYDQGGGISFRIHGDSVVVTVEQAYIGQERREPLKFFLDRSQAVNLAKNIIDIVKGQDEVDAWVKEQVKSALHVIAANEQFVKKA